MTMRPEILLDSVPSEVSPDATAPAEGTGAGAAGSETAEGTLGPQASRRQQRLDDFAAMASGRSGRVISAGALTSTTEKRGSTAILTLEVPEDAAVYVNDQKMKTKGAKRSFVAKNLRYDRPNTYEIRVVTIENGEELTQTKVIDLTPDRDSRLAFDFEREVLPVTSLTLRVPENAKVRLAGVETESVGGLRYFYTNTLDDGQVWSDYEVEVQWEENGETIVKTQTVELMGGSPLQLQFGEETAEMTLAAN